MSGTIAAGAACTDPALARAGVRPVAGGMLLAAGVALVAALLGHAVRSTAGGQAAVDEPQYLLTAASLWHDHDLDISDELSGQVWRDYHQADLPQQTEPRSDGSALSPHDPLLPLLLAAPVGLLGLAGAKVALALVSAATAALTVWTAVRRLSVPVPLAATGTALAFASAPLVVYAQQVYPELPAALVTLVAVAVLTGPAAALAARRGLLVLGLAVTALPWLGIKYAPVAVGLAAVALWRLRSHRRAGAALTLGLVGSGLLYLLAHRLLWGGFTAYASGDQFTSTGELSVVGVTPDYAGRSLRLIALLVDRGYGLAAWAPAWLLLVPAVGAAVAGRRRLARDAPLLVPLLAGWATATWAALTMHGFWWPGRQVVVVLPLALLLVLAWLAERGPRVRAAAGVAAAGGVLTYTALVVAGSAGTVAWASGLGTPTSREGLTGAPVHALLQPLWPDYRVLSSPGTHPGSLAGHLAWSAAALAVVLLPLRHTRSQTVPTSSSTPSTPVSTSEEAP